MGCHDEICLVCAISPAGGPHSLIHHSNVAQESAKLAEEILALRPDLQMDATGIASIVAVALELDWDECRDVGLPKIEGAEGLWAGHWDGLSRAVLVGHWNEGECVNEWEELLVDDPDDEDSPYYEHRFRFPTGLDVAVLPGVIPEGCEPCFYFAEKGPTFDANYGQKSTLGTFLTNYIGVYNKVMEENPNVTLSTCCFDYLLHWIDFERLPPPRISPSGNALSLPGELYEIVNSRLKHKGGVQPVDLCFLELTSPRGTVDSLPCINYDDIDITLDQYQSHFECARRGVENVAQAISSGLRGVDLIPALRQDYRCWAFMRTDIWPLPSMAGMDKLVYTVHSMKETPSPQPKRQLDDLPNDILFEIFDQISIPSFLALASTCRSLRARLLSPDVADPYFKHLVYTGQLRWILPVPGVPEEDEHAEDAAVHWLAHVGSSYSKDEADTAPFDSPDFPYYQFARACHLWDCTRNRRRIWGIVKQFEVLWHNYRLHGWEVDRFIRDK
ncbi:hypothetical protein HGRIS_009515 [Hohenbuehelia grisea]|uniref:F-box domain-containing protein n=1 Tax=Hohenbuehelia grisea TaxID=104357 RepID=A0ABR3J1N5_9AGAR